MGEMLVHHVSQSIKAATGMARPRRSLIILGIISNEENEISMPLVLLAQFNVGGLVRLSCASA